MLHEAKEERQIGFFHALFVKRQDQRVLGGVQQEIGVFDTFGDALVGCERANVVLYEEIPQIIFGDVRINCQFQIS